MAPVAVNVYRRFLVDNVLSAAENLFEFPRSFAVMT